MASKSKAPSPRHRSGGKRSDYRAKRNTSSSPKATPLAGAESPHQVQPASYTRAGGAAVVTPVVDRSREYAYIRADLKRLLITASALLAIMIVLLFLLDR